MTPATLLTIAIYGVCILGYGMTFMGLAVMILLMFVPMHELDPKYHDARTAMKALIHTIILTVGWGTITTIIYASLLVTRNSL